jgi:beta-glucoside operon transcriptional antiterminator
MKAIKKINNNVALCVDSKGKELVAFGRGIGFPIMPYEVSLDKISITFYRIDRKSYDLISELPEDVLVVSALIVDHARSVLQCNLNPNLVVSLADHINFAIVRIKKYKEMKLPFSYEVEQFYPKETELARYTISLIQKKLGVSLPGSEVASIAMHFVNAEEEQVTQGGSADIEALIYEVVAKVEQNFDIVIDRNGLSYNRFVLHLRYYLKRLQDSRQFSDDNAILVREMREKFSMVYRCAEEVGAIIGAKYQAELSESELFYLVLHINRMVQSTIDG